MTKFIAFIIFLLPSYLSATKAMREISVGDSCLKIESVEVKLGSIVKKSTIKKNEVLFTEEATHRNHPAEILYSCGKERWSQSIVYGNFVEDEAIKEFNIVSNKLRILHGNPEHSIENYSIFKRIYLMILDYELYRQSAYSMMWEFQDSQLLLSVDDKFMSDVDGNHLYQIFYSLSPGVKTIKCNEPECEEQLSKVYQDAI